MTAQKNWQQDVNPEPAAGPEEGGAAPAAANRPKPQPAVYQGWFGKTVKAFEPTTEADPVAILVTLISGFSVMIGSRPKVIIHDDHHPLLIWSLIAGYTGSGRKGMSLNPVKRLIRIADLDFYRDCFTSGLSSGEGLTSAVADAEDEQDPGGKKLFVIETEYSVTMARAGREGNTLGGVLRQAWEGDNLRIMTKVKVHATEPHIGIVAHITPGEFRARVKSADMAGGTYNRFLPIYSERSREIALGEGASPNLVATIALELQELVKKAQDVGKVGLTPEAQGYWTEVVYPALSAASVRDGVVAQFTARATPYCRRLAALYALADGHVIVGRSHMEAAYHLVNYSRASAAFILGATSTGDPDLDKALIALTNAAPDTLTRTSFANDVFAKAYSKTRLDDVLTKLAQLPGVVAEKRSTGGRPAEHWFLRPEKAEEPEEAQRPADTSSGDGTEKGRNKVHAPGSPDLYPTYSVPSPDEVPAGQGTYSASSAFSGTTHPEDLPEPPDETPEPPDDDYEV